MNQKSQNILHTLQPGVQAQPDLHISTKQLQLREHRYINVPNVE